MIFSALARLKSPARLFLIFICLISCDDEVSKTETLEIRYEVVSHAPRWFGEYIIESGEKVCNCKAPLLSTNWSHTFNVAKPFILHIDATVDPLQLNDPSTPDITTNIFVDGDLVATGTSNWAKGVASADYELK